MPKVKKIRSAALAAKESRHAPLGQMIQEDENRGKYAAAIRSRGKKLKDDKEEDELMDEKTTKKILELSREQQLELEREEMQRDQRKRNHQAPGSDDEDDDDDESVPLEDNEEE
jgi:essential nuclear protein 1